MSVGPVRGGARAPRGVRGVAGAPFRLRPARLADAEALAPRLRLADAREIRALGWEPCAGLRAALETSERAMAGLDETGAVIALYGVARAPQDPVIGAPWLLGADAMARHPRAVLRLARAELPLLGRGFELLVNRADARNRLHLAWVRALGFSCLRGHPLGPERRLFIEFARLASWP